MLFNSIAYILFLAVTVGAYYALPTRGRWLLLLLASLFCYGLWRVDYLLLLFFCTALSYSGALRIQSASEETSKKWILRGVLLGNLGLLFTFKYAEFAYSTMQFLGPGIVGKAPSLALDLVLPIGISFYIFQSIGYVVDVYWGLIEPERRFWRFFLFVSFFPQLIAGPIEKAEELLPQLNEPTSSLTEERLLQGIGRIFWGLFKKVVVADNISLYTDVVFGNVGLHSGATMYVALVLFAFQIYCDFSGYTDIAIGSARLFGIKLSENFLLPYGSVTVREFWTRWHKTLYTWLYTYIYLPIAFAIPGKKGVALAVLTTFFISGLWHGASWNFVIFGLIHGFWILLEVTLLAKLADSNRGHRKVIGNVITFHVWLFSLIWFRVPSFELSCLFLQRMFAGGTVAFLDLGVFARIVTGLVILLLAEKFLVKADTFDTIQERIGLLGCLALVLASLFLMILLGNSGGGQFIYFQF